MLKAAHISILVSYYVCDFVPNLDMRAPIVSLRGLFETDWWSSELGRMGKRPTVDTVGQWYAAYTASCWDSHTPFLDETRTHAKCL